MSFEEIGEKIKIARNALGWSQQELAAATGLRQATISDIETAKYDEDKGRYKAGRNSIMLCLLKLELQFCITTPTDKEIEEYRTNTSGQPINNDDESHQEQI